MPPGMDDLLKIVLEEVALEESQGCTPERLWSLLEERRSKDQNAEDDTDDDALELRRMAGNDSIRRYVQLDSHMKEYLWSFIISVDDIRCVNRQVGNVHSVATPKSAKKGKGKRKSEQEPAESTLDVDNTTPIPTNELTSMSLRQALEKYGDGLHIVASEEVRRIAILGHYDPTVKLSAALFATLSLIAKCRSAGITQMELSKVLHYDPRSLFHYIKVLGEMKFIVKFPLVTKGTYTNLCIHKRFADQNNTYQEYKKRTEQMVGPAKIEGLDSAVANSTICKYNPQTAVSHSAGHNAVSYHSELVKEQITTLLRAAKNHVMVVQDLMQALKLDTSKSRFERKWFNRLIETLVKGGFLERVNVPRRRDGWECKGHDRCVRLLKMYLPSGGVNIGLDLPSRTSLQYQSKQQTADPERDIIMGEGGVLADLPFEWQVYRLIALSGKKGVTAGVVQRSLNNVGSRLLNKILTKLLKPPDAPVTSIGANRVAEFVGRERRYRYYSSEAYNHMMGHTEQAAELGLLEKMVASGGQGETRSTPNSKGPPEKKRRLVNASTANTVESAPEQLADGSRNSNTADCLSSLGDVICTLCYKSDNEDQILLCHHCKSGIHTYCHNPPLTAIPQGDFFCSSTCRKSVKPTGEQGSATQSSQFDPMDVDSSTEQQSVTQPLPVSPIARSKTAISTPTTTAIPSGATTPGSGLYNRTSITAVRRRNHLLQLVEDKKILEVGHLLVKAYQDLVSSQQDGSTPVHTVDKKTLVRTAKAMEADGLLKIHTITLPQMNGGYSSKMLFLHRSLEPTDNRVQEYIAMMHDRHVLLGGKYKPAKVEIEDLEVERLEDLHKRAMIEKEYSRSATPTMWGQVGVFRGVNGDELAHMANTLGSGGSHIMEGIQNSQTRVSSPAVGAGTHVSPNNEIDVKTPTGQSLDLQRQTESKKKLPGSQDPDSDQFWLNVAQHYGYINAKMLRARYLHEWLWNRVLDRKDQSERTPASISGGPYKNGGIFQAAMLFRELSFDMFLKIVGQTVASPVVDEFMRRPDYADVKIGDLPPALRTVVFGGKTRYRRSLKQILDILEALHIVMPMPRLDENGKYVHAGLGDERASIAAMAADYLHPVYRLEWRVPLYDWGADDQRLLRHYTIESLEDLKQYWFQLEFTCSRKDTQRIQRWRAYEEGQTEESLEQHDNGPIDLTTEENYSLKVRSERPGYLMKDSHPLAHLNNVRNWHTTFPYSAHQRNILESHVDRRTGETPLDNDLLCRQLAEDTGLGIARVKYYFKRAEDMYQAKVALQQQAREKRKLTLEKRRQELGVGRYAVGIRPRSLKTGRITRAARATFDHEGQEEAGGKEQVQRAGRKVREVLQRQRESRVPGRRSFRAGAGNGPAAGRGPVVAVASGLEELNEENIPVIADEDRFQTQYQQVAKRVRPNWTAQDDETLLHAYAIMHNRSGPRFQWIPLAALFEGSDLSARKGSRMTELCRRRMNVLLKSPVTQDRLNNLTSQWPAILAKGVAENKLEAQENVDIQNLNLAPMIEYFITTNAALAKSKTDSAPLIPLPSTSQELERFFVVKNKLSRSIQALTDLEDELDERYSSRSKMSVLYARSLTGLLTNEDQVDFAVSSDPTCEQVEENVVKAVIKMILMTPESAYDPTHAFWILHAFPHHVIANALRKMNEDQSIVKIKGSTDRRVPGRGFVLSDKFLSTIAGPLPDRLLPQAVAYHRELFGELKNGQSMFSPFANSGAMAALLEAVAARLIRLQPKFNIRLETHGVFELYDNPSMGNADVCILPPATELLVSRTTTTDKGKRKADDIEVPSDAKRTKDGHTEPPRPEVDEEVGTISTTACYGETAEEVLNNAPIAKESDRIWMRKIYEVVKEAGICGVSALNLQSTFRGFGIDGNQLDKYLRMFSTTFRLAKPPVPLVSQVGFSDIRYVSDDNLSRWTVATTRQAYEQSGDIVVESMQLDAPRAPKMGSDDFTAARMWYDINGKQVDSVKRACMEAVLGTIVQKPGIYEAKLYRRLGSVMTRVELAEILQILVDRGACRRKCLLKPRPITSLFGGLFGPNGHVEEYTECAETYLDDHRISCYWPQEEWYLKTLM
ncbi:hypothetical protein, variant [Spizellomyces punctatus DAOM BR117]|uniref:B-block binding subunit of TFIIIC domain-containing protein n=1 Tax=Spizellomyces punctatus (strain DAOM BR117) TaxID=645134 RepID=A0A0L0H7G9_SPIPD|nr:hypothetical protein, variant [Spizellomyces punctatus DAOM BR117]KNC96633.1 hypothetical protein, variant [Spizellomyces punctatus DAOM BR117]|eukprot:XP_016604673.1 hypothetical protein, variant [Spizellomyces punctatus DAOM BR117]